MAITKNLVVTLKDDVVELKDKMFIFRNDVGVEMIIELKDFEYSIDAIGNKNNFSKVSAIFRTPSGKLYSYNDIKVSSGKIRFVFTQDLINVMQEIGEYELQFQLYDKLNNRLTIPSYNFYVKEPLSLPNEAIVGEGRVGFSYVAEDETYLFSIEDGYIKTEWEVGDLITKGKLNKIENAIFDVVNVINNMDITNNNPNLGNQHTHNNMGILNTITADKINQWDNKSDFDGNYNNLINKPPIPTEISDLINDVGYLTSIPNEYVTDSELNNKGYLTEHQDISGKVDKISGYSLVSDAEIDRLATLENYDDTNLNIALDNLTNAINKTQIDKSTIPTKTSELINDVGYLTSIPNEYVTDSELNSKGYLTEHQDISGKVDKVNGYSLVSDAEIDRLATLENYDDTEVRELVDEINTSLDNITNRVEYIENNGSGGGSMGGSLNLRDVLDGEIFTIETIDTPTVTYGQIVVSKSSTTITEGSTDTFTVKLDKAPTNNQVVTLNKNNSDVTLSSYSLTFSPSNYSTAQTVTITVAEDNTEYSNETCRISISSPNVSTKTLIVNITDNDTEEPEEPDIPAPTNYTNYIYNSDTYVNPKDITQHAIKPGNASIYWQTYKSTKTVSNGVATVLFNSEKGFFQCRPFTGDGKTYYCSYLVDSESVAYVNTQISSTSAKYKKDLGNGWTLCASVVVDSKSDFTSKIEDRRTSDWTPIQTKEWMKICLTDLYPNGNYPSVEECSNMFKYVSGIIG